MQGGDFCRVRQIKALDKVKLKEQIQLMQKTRFKTMVMKRPTSSRNLFKDNRHEIVETCGNDVKFFNLKLGTSIAEVNLHSTEWNSRAFLRNKHIQNQVKQFI